MEQLAPPIPKPIIQNPSFTTFNVSKYEFSTASKRDTSVSFVPRETQFTLRPHSPEEKSSMLYDGIWESLLYTDKSPLKPTKSQFGNKTSKSPKPESRVAKSSQNLLDRYEAAKERSKKSALMQSFPFCSYRLVEECSFRPLLSKKSMKIASNLQDPKQRLLEDKKYSEWDSKLANQTKVQCPFKPKINSNAKALDARNKAGTKTPNKSRFELLFEENRRKEDEMEARRMINQREQDFDENLTFQPKISQRSKRATSVYMGPAKSSKPLPMRSMEWKRKRDERIIQAQENKEIEEEQSCTFRPTIRHENLFKGPDKGADLSDFGKKGLVNYIERVDNARKKKQEREVSANSRYGEKWENKITVPKEFSFKTDRNPLKQDFKKSNDHKVLVLVDRSGNERHLEDKSMTIDYVPMEGRKIEGNGREFESALYNLHQKLHNFNF